MLKPQMPAVDDLESAKVPDSLPKVVDAHVHVFPRAIFAAIQKWFDTHAWPIRYRMSTEQIFEFLLSKGIQHVVALQYAHKPGIAQQLNEYLAQKCQAFEGRVTGMATVFPGEDNALDILQQGFDLGLGGLKLHAHVQCFDMNSADMDPLYACCAENGKPLIMHVGREPKSPAYRCDPYTLCRADKLEQVLKRFPDLKVCVPHLGFDETKAYRELTERYDTLWLDTTMVITDYFDLAETIDLGWYRADRVMYGSDFPNIPFAWDRELKVLENSRLSKDHLERIAGRNAAEFYGFSL